MLQAIPNYYAQLQEVVFFVYSPGNKFFSILGTKMTIKLESEKK